MAKYRAYYTLLERDDVRSVWRIEFGDYDLQTVANERDDRLDHDVKRINTHIIVTDHTQEAIQARVDHLNANTRRRCEPAS